MKKWLKRISIGFWIIATVYLFAAWIVLGVQNTRLIHNQLLPPATVIGEHISQDPTLVADAQQLGLDYSGVNLSFAPTLSAPDVVGTSTVGEFTPPNSIQIKAGLTKPQELQTVAYEFMHYYWQNLPLNIQQQMTTVYQQYYDSNTDFQQLTKYYTGNSSVIADERNSTACTQVQPYLLSTSFNIYCNQFIPNRSILFT